MIKTDVLLIKTIVLLVSLVFVNGAVNNIPKYDPHQRIIDCTDGKDATDGCDVTLVVEFSTSMTYYNISRDFRELQGHRARFNSAGCLSPPVGVFNMSNLLPPIQTDGHFRTIITINAQMPGPTIIAHENQTLHITVFNELKNVEGIAIHWHGIHQRGTPEADGVAYITQNPILSLHSYTYTFKASPAGTHWYHAHSGEQRTDGLYGAFIVKDTLPANVYDYDYPEQHTILLMDWQRETQHNSLLSTIQNWKEAPINHPPYTQYTEPFQATFGPDGVITGLIPFWSGIINDKGRFYDELGRPNIVNPNCDNLNCFNVSQGYRYRFRLIGAQAFYTFRFSIEGHSLTVVASDSSPINSIDDVDYVIVSPGERYDVIVHANNTELRNFWIWAETLEDEANRNNLVFYNPISKHRAEAILHYTEYNATDITEINETKTCTPSSKCKAVNCPFPQYGTIMECINVEQFESPPSISIPQSIHSPDVTMFYSFGFDGETSLITSASVDGVNFRYPANPPLTEYKDFQNSNNTCPNRGCDHDKEPYCTCTQVIDIGDLARGSVVELVITNRGAMDNSMLGSAHPVHLHGHHFYIVAIGYGDYDADGSFSTASDDLECVVQPNNQTCPEYFTTVGESGELKQEVRWRDMIAPTTVNTENKKLARKDTIMAPFGGYAVIRFIVDNPGWWLLHSHNEVDRLHGMVTVIKELAKELYSSDYNNTDHNSTDYSNNVTSNSMCTCTEGEVGSSSSSSSNLSQSLLVTIASTIAVLYFLT